MDTKSRIEVFEELKYSNLYSIEWFKGNVLKDEDVINAYNKNKEKKK